MIETNRDDVRLEVRLVGPAAEGGRMRVDALIEVAHAVQTAVTRLAYGLRGEATVRRGRTPREIADLTRLEVVSLREGSAVLEFDLAEHERPLDEFDLGMEALRSFEAGVVLIASGEDPPDPWDEGVVQAVRQLTRTLDKGVDEVAIGRVGAPVEQRAIFTRLVLDGFRRAAPHSPSELIEIEGRLLMADFAATHDEARIHRPLEPPVRCTFGPELESMVLKLLRRYVRATGVAELDDRGGITKLALVSLEDAEPAAGRSFWDLSTLDELADDQGVEPIGRLEDLASDFWPEDESVDDFLAAIESRN